MHFNILDANGNLSNETSPVDSISLTYNLNTDSIWIYSNYPEAIPPDGFGDTNLGNRFLNQATVPSGEHQIFYSYQDTKYSLGPYFFSIQVYNPNNTPLLFQILNTSHRDSINDGGWPGANGGIWEDFFNSTAEESISIPSNGVHWFNEYVIPKSSVFNGSVRFSVNNNAVITLYVYKSKSAIDGTAAAYPEIEPVRQYSGVGNGYFFTAEPITLKASELTNGKFFLISYPDSFTSLTINSKPATTDLIPLRLVDSGTLVSPPTGNLGNWCAQYYYTLNLVNDTNTRKTFSAYIRTDVGGDSDDWPVIQSGSQCKFARINPSELNSWKWLSHSVDANSTFTGSFQYILGTNSFGKSRHIFRVN